jgi:DNA-3-methyladenine glycosylase
LKRLHDNKIDEKFLLNPDIRLHADFYSRDNVVLIAKELLGKILVTDFNETITAARIVETEAYLGGDDLASHSASGITNRTRVIFGPPGHAYVYFVYGMHHCLNIAVDGPGTPGCVLIRGAEPLPGSGLGERALSGPGKLCRALGIDARLSGRHLFEPEAPLTLRAGLPPAKIAVTRRIGINVAQARRLRFYDPASPAVSAARRAGISLLPGRRRAKAPRARLTAKRGSP